MHVVSQADVEQHRLDGTPIPVKTVKIPITVMAYGICGQETTVERINVNREILLQAGNHPAKQAIGVNKKSYANRLQLILGTDLVRIDYFICGKEDSMANDLQVATWTSGGLVVVILLLMAGVLSLSCVTIHTLTIIWRFKTEMGDRDLFRTSSTVEALCETISWICLFASLLYATFTWSERVSSKSAFGVGYVVMAIASIIISYKSIGISLQGIKSRLASSLQKRRQSSNSSLPNIV